ncbi:unnamed protein product [Ectocarpus sp. CCAP 1310/34]|nr:unnamed protein product [Ectocarpus sp. CCAP 1310/34]
MEAFALEIEATLAQRRQEMGQEWDGIDEEWQTLRKRMTKRPSTWAMGNMFEAESENRVARDSDGRIVLDESPTWVKHLVQGLLFRSSLAKDTASRDGEVAGDDILNLLHYTARVLGLSGQLAPVLMPITGGTAILEPHEASKLTAGVQGGTNSMIGWFSGISWAADNCYSSCPEAFVFLAPRVVDRGQAFGPTFGGGHDLKENWNRTKTTPKTGNYTYDVPVGSPFLQLNGCPIVDIETFRVCPKPTNTSSSAKGNLTPYKTQWRRRHLTTTYATALAAVYCPDMAMGLEVDFMELSVRGTRMTTLRSTLRVCPDSALATRFDEDKWPAAKKDLDSNGRRVIDCKPAVFSKVLDVLRMATRASWAGSEKSQQVNEKPRVTMKVGDRVAFEEFVGMNFPGCESCILDFVDLRHDEEADPRSRGADADGYRRYDCPIGMSSAGDEERTAASGEQIRPPVQEGSDAELASSQLQVSRLAALVEESTKKDEPGSIVADAASRGSWVAAPAGQQEPLQPHGGGGGFVQQQARDGGHGPTNEKGMNLNHWDVKQAYTHATLDEVFLRLSAWCGDQSHKIVNAERAIYCLKQSGRRWGSHAADTLVENGFEQCKADPWVFRKMVDEVVELLASLHKKFPTKNLGEFEWFDGCAIERDVEAGTLRISQTAYIDSMVKRFDVQSTSRIPASPGVDLGPKRDDEKRGEWPVREAIGSMMWVSTFSRPDVSFAVRAILGYLKETKDLGSSKTQSIVALSSTEVEYIAAGEGVKEVLFVGAVLSSVAPETSGSSIQVLEDNQGAMALVQNPLSSGRTKHIDVRFHFIRGLFKSGDISVMFVPTTEQHADFLTKALSRASLQYHRRKLMNLPEYL